MHDDSNKKSLIDPKVVIENSDRLKSGRQKIILIYTF